MTVALYPGSFDPVHNGHLAVIEQSAILFDSVVVGVGHNPDKPSGLFSPEQRAELLETAVADLDNVRVELFTGLVTVAAVAFGASCLIKGLRGATDLDTEMQQAHMNLTTGSIGTVFLPATGASALVAATYIRQIAAMGGDVSSVVPAHVLDALNQRFSS
jgi:pantetheine-phosphate adenylyltransferase